MRARVGVVGVRTLWGDAGGAIAPRCIFDSPTPHRPRLASEAEESLEELKVLRGETSNIQIAGPTAPQPGSEAPAASAGATTSAGSDTPKWKDPSVTRTLPKRAAGAPLVLASAYDGMAADEALAVEVLASASHRADPPAGAGLGNEGASSDAPLGVALPGVEAVRRQAAAAAPRHGGSTGQPAVRKRPSRSPQPPAKRAR